MMNESTIRPLYVLEIGYQLLFLMQHLQVREHDRFRYEVCNEELAYI